METMKGNRMTTKTGGYDFGREWITPDKANQILEGNRRNRSMNLRHLARLRVTMEAGEFVYNGQPIQITKDGDLLDGQHRLMACVLSGIPFESLVIWDALPAMQETMDMGKSRTVADVLRLRGHKNQHVLAALGRRIAVSEVAGFRGAITSTLEVSSGAVLRAAENIVDIQRYINMSKSIAVLCNFHSGVLAYLIWSLDQVDRVDSEFFFDRLRSGEGLTDGDPIHALRQFGLNRDRAGRGTYHHNVQTAGVVIKAWNKYRQGEPVKRLNFRVGGSQPEEIPEPV